MKNLILSVAALAIVFVSCSDDDDSGVPINPPQAAILQGGPYAFCVNGLPDNINDDVVADAGVGGLSSFVVTDVAGGILGLPADVSGPDFDGAGVGECYVYHINYLSDLEGLTGPDADTGEPTANINDLVGNFALSNFLTVNREDCAPNVTAATLEVGPSAMDGEYTFIVDGTPDNVTDLVVADAGAGENAQIVVTDENGWILGLPPVFEGPDFDAAGVGVCYIRHVNYDGAITGLTGPDTDTGEPTANINDLEGEFKVSNIIVVNRIMNTAPSAVGATLQVGPSAIDGEYTFTVDGTPDLVTDLVVVDAGAGTYNTFVITNADGDVLGLPPTVADFPDFDAAGVGVCLIWHLNYEGDPDTFFDGVSNASDLTGDFALSNSLTVNRNGLSVAAVLEGGPYTFTVDGTPDFVTDLVVVDAGTGTNNTFVITNADGDVLGLPPTVADFPDFDVAGVGVCLIWHLNYEGDPDTFFEGVANASDLTGDYALSNPLEVNRI